MLNTIVLVKSESLIRLSVCEKNKISSALQEHKYMHIVVTILQKVSPTIVTSAFMTYFVCCAGARDGKCPLSAGTLSKVQIPKHSH